ncbi:MAG: helix-turn-helix domain-containing protein [Candidatus Promineifilaceae bacterium]|jgi:transcriptional regulator with XRE-family HTH domain
MNEEVQTRAEFLGQLIKEARMTAGISVEQCASIIGLNTIQYAALEQGERIASLPELEVLAMFFKVPMSYFFGDTGSEEIVEADFRSYLALRQMMIGAMLGQVRIQANLSVEELSEETGIAVNQLLAYETGQYPIPYFDLETLSARLGASIKVFVDDEYGPLAENEAERQLEKRFSEWTPKMKMFIADSRNQAYLETAMRLSEMDADRLRNIAEGILEITL